MSFKPLLVLLSLTLSLALPLPTSCQQTVASCYYAGL